MSGLRLQVIVDAVAPPLLAVGFEERPRTTNFLKRPSDDHKVAATGPAFTWRMNEDVLGIFVADGSTKSGVVSLSPIFGVRHEGIMELIDEAGVNIDGHQALFKPELTDYHYLTDRQPDRPLAEIKRGWLFESQEDVERFVPRVQACLKRIVLPYMRRCRSLAGIVDEIVKGNSARHETRPYYVVAAGLHLLGRNGEVLDWFEQWLTEYAKPEYNDVQDAINRDRKYSRWLIKRMKAEGWKAPQRRLKALEHLLRKR